MQIIRATQTPSGCIHLIVRIKAHFKNWKIEYGNTITNSIMLRPTISNNNQDGLQVTTL